MSIARVAALLWATSAPILVSAQSSQKADVFDQFFRHVGNDNRVSHQGVTAETVDPFTGTLRIVREDLVLAGAAGLDLKLVRTYSSKLWGRSDLLDMEPLLAEKEPTVLGYGWSFHMGRLRDPYASGETLGVCGGAFPVYEAPDGNARVFYPVATDVFVSKDYWRMERNCAALGGAGVCIWSDAGLRYEFSNRYENSFTYGGTTLMFPVSAIVDPFANRITITYESQTGAVKTITDTYERTIEFAYTGNGADRRLDTVTANGKTFHYFYDSYATLAGSRRFLTQVAPPAGPSEYYGYNIGPAATVATNQYALNSITYPAGGQTTFTYEPAEFFTGRETVPFSVVKTRTVVGTRGVTPGEYSYSYSSPGPGVDLHVTTITRPDGKHDVHEIVGFGYVAGTSNATERNTYSVGLTWTVTRADRTEVEGFSWDPNQVPSISGVVYAAPVYSSNCGGYWVWDDHVYVGVMTQHDVWRDGALFTTKYSNFDAYAQPRTVTEIGRQGAGNFTRTTQWSFFYAPTEGPGPNGPTLNLVHGRPLSQRICLGAACPSTCSGDLCVENSWTYGGPHFALDSETRSGVKTRFTYHLGDTEGPGNLESVTNALGQTVRMSGYGAGRGWGAPTEIDLNGAYTIRRTAKWEGWIESETNGRGFTTSFNYDDVGRVKTVTPPGQNAPTTYDYAADGSTVTLTRGTYWKQSALDGLGRVVSEVDSEGTRTAIRYDAMGRVWFRSYPFSASAASSAEVGTAYELDGLGRVVRETKAHRPSVSGSPCDDEDSCHVTHAYEVNRVQTTVSRARGDSTTTYRYGLAYGDPAEQLIALVYDGAGQRWRFTYNAARKLRSVVAPLSGGSREYQYDARQFPLAEVTGESGAVAFVPNGIGQVLARSDARPVTAHNAYDDPLSRLTRVWYDGGNAAGEVTFRHDDANNLSYVASASGGAYDIQYDELNRPSQQTWTVDGVRFVTGYHHDAAGCLDAVTYPSGAKLIATCDTNNRVKTLVLEGGDAIVRDVTYEPTGQVHTITYGNGITTTVDHDARGRTKTIAAPGALYLSYAYDGADNVLQVESAAPRTWTRVMTYDPADRLATVATEAGTTVYAYDALGNRLSSTLGPNAATVYTYDSDRNRLTALHGPVDSMRSMKLTWNAAGRLETSSDGAVYRYDGLGRRVAKTVGGSTTLYHYDPAGTLIAETGPDGTKIAEYVYVAGHLVAVDRCASATTRSCSNREWYHTDALGSVLAQTSRAGTRVAEFEYGAFGEQRFAPAGAGDRQYNGRVYDAGTGFHDYGARMYWPEIGRFISADSYGGNIADPASLNRYSYVKNNPYKYTDPTGHFAAALPALYNALVELGQLCAEGGCQRAAAALAAALELSEKADSAQQAQSSANGEKAAQHTAGQSTPATPPESEPPNKPEESSRAKLVTNPKHHPNSRSPEPSNAAELYKRSIEDKNGVRWAKDKDGTIHRFSKPSNGESHWNGSTAGDKPIRPNDIPAEVRRQL